jgi:hypothetical protein
MSSNLSLKQQQTAYESAVIDAIEALDSRRGTGSSKQSIKSWVMKHSSIVSPQEHLINEAIKRGVEAGRLIQPKGPTGPVALKKRHSFQHMFNNNDKPIPVNKFISSWFEQTGTEQSYVNFYIALSEVIDLVRRNILFADEYMNISLGTNSGEDQYDGDNTDESSDDEHMDM